MANITKIINLAKEKGISNTFICSKLGLSRGYLNDVKNGKATISDERLKLISEILGTTPEYLNDETNKKEKSQTVKYDSGLSENTILICRGGDTKELHFTKEQIEAIEKLLETIDTSNSDNL